MKDDTKVKLKLPEKALERYLAAYAEWYEGWGIVHFTPEELRTDWKKMTTAQKIMQLDNIETHLTITRLTRGAGKKWNADSE